MFFRKGDKLGLWDILTKKGMKKEDIEELIGEPTEDEKQEKPSTENKEPPRNEKKQETPPEESKKKLVMEANQTEVETLKKQLEQTKIDYALKLALIENKAQDVDYLAYKIKEKNELKLTDKGTIDGIEKIIAETKTAYTTQFAPSKQEKKIDENKLPEGEKKKPGITQEQFNKMGYQARLKLFNENKELYNELKGE